MTGIDGISCRGQCRAQPCDDGGHQPLLSEPGARVREQDSSKTSCPEEVDNIHHGYGEWVGSHSFLPRSYTETEARYETKVCPKTRKN